MKKFLGIALFLSLTLPFIVTFAWLNHQQHLIRKEVKEQMLKGMDKKDLVHMVFNESEYSALNWRRKQEFEYQGALYDVVKRENIDGKVHLWCWWDYDETKLNNELNRLSAELFGLRHDQENNQNTLLDFYKTLYHQSETDLDLRLFYYDEGLYGIYDNGTISGAFSPPSPPPELS